MKLFLVRHPQPVVEPGICYGRRDLHVDLAHLEAVAQALGRLLPPGLAAYSSPLFRCARLAARLQEQGHVEAVQIDQRLIEMHFGRWEGCAWDALPREEIDAWGAALESWAPPGGESLGAMAARCDAFLAAVRERGEDALAVTHAGPMQVMMKRLRGESLARFGGSRLAFGDLVTIEWETTGAARIEHVALVPAANAGTPAPSK